MLPALFNPSNDMALAVNLRRYVPPRRIRQMEEDLCGLSRFWDEGPWGWSMATKERYLKMNIAAHELPDDEWLEEVRRLSNRKWAAEYYHRLTERLNEWRGQLVPCRVRYVCDSGELETAGGPLMVKTPWSSSGRGNFIVDDTPARHPTGNPAVRQRIEASIREQGGVVAEPFYTDKALDFAMEFRVESGTADGREALVRFIGYSVFSTDETGHYGGNYVESQEELLRRIDLPRPLLQTLIDYHCEALSRLPYRGPVGIDMMRLADGRVHPCVEINFRMTMGLLALQLYDKGITDDQRLAGVPEHGFEACIRRGRLVIAFHP